MQYFNQINQALFHSENVERFLNGNSFEWSNRSKRIAVSNWLKSISSLNNPELLPKMEPLLFVLADKICLEERGRLILFLREIINSYSLIPNDFLPPKEEINLILARVLHWESISENFYDLSIQGLGSLSVRPSSSTFFCKIKEFHPRKLYVKHPWNEVQLSSLHSVSTKVLFDLVNNPNEPIEGHRFFIGSETGPAYGIAIINGHHRIYELYKRFINSQLVSEKTISGTNGDILVQVVEKY